MPKFVPLTFLKDTASIVEFCQECGEPIFVTRNGTPERFPYYEAKRMNRSASSGMDTVCW